jgi:hypothetical protein
MPQPTHAVVLGPTLVHHADAIFSVSLYRSIWRSAVRELSRCFFPVAWLV